jgi:hypothetical protein
VRGVLDASGTDVGEACGPPWCPRRADRFAIAMLRREVEPGATVRVEDVARTAQATNARVERMPASQG